MAAQGGAGVMAGRGAISKRDKEQVMSDDDFVLDRTENPHPRMLAEALEARRVSGESVIKASFWGGYLAAMVAATGEPAEAIQAWMDRNAAR